MAKKKAKGVKLRWLGAKSLRYVEPDGASALAGAGATFTAAQDWCERIEKRQPKKWELIEKL